MAMDVFESRTYYQVTMLNAVGESMDFVQITASLTVTDTSIHQVCANLIGLDHQEDGYVRGPCTALRIEKIQDTVTTIEQPA